MIYLIIKKMRLYGVFFLSSFLCLNTLYAYVLPSEFLINILASERIYSKVKNVSMDVQIKENNTTKNGKIYIKIPGRFCYIEDDTDPIMYIENEGRRAIKDSQNIFDIQKGPIKNIIPTLLVPFGKDLSGMSQNMLNRLKELNIDTEKVTFSRFQGRYVYIIGAHVWETQKNQIWIDKKTFLPVKTLLKEQKEDTIKMQETRFLEYDSSITSNWFPKIIEVWQENKRIKFIEVIDLEYNQEISDTLFNIPTPKN